MRCKNIAIVGTVGVPASYGGFETLVENLVSYHHDTNLREGLTVYCSSKSYKKKQVAYLSAQLKYIPLNANGARSIPYDIWSLFSAVWHKGDVILLLGVSGAVVLPLVRMFSRAKIVTNIDGIEWRREKWKGLAKWFLHLSEKFAVRFSHEVISDNAAIASYVKESYGVDSYVIAYGGDHAMAVEAVAVSEYQLPKDYAFSVCRIEPENNVYMVVDAFSKQNLPLVLIGNWNNSEYGKKIREDFKGYEHLFLLDPVYDLGKLKTLRSNALVFLHGHSAGGTNPSLVEAMHFSKPVLAYDCDFNRETTEGQALFFQSSDEICERLAMDRVNWSVIGEKMGEIAKRRYTWQKVAEQYMELLG